MGGGDLNMKKHFHPLTMENLERVWKAEQKAKAEKERIEQLQAELAEERRREELEQHAIDQGVMKKKANKLDWMYNGQTANTEEYLLGRRIDKNVEVLKEDNNVSELPGASFKEDTSKSTAVDLAAKIKEDPLFLIKKKEEENRKELIQNPLKLRKLKQMLQASVLESSGHKKKSKKRNNEDKKRKSKKAKKEKRRKRGDSSLDESPSEDEVTSRRENIKRTHAKDHQERGRNSMKEKKDGHDDDRHKRKRRKSEEEEKLETEKVHKQRKYCGTQDSSDDEGKQKHERRDKDRDKRRKESQRGDLDNHLHSTRKRRSHHSSSSSDNDHRTRGVDRSEARGHAKHGKEAKLTSKHRKRHSGINSSPDDTDDSIEDYAEHYGRERRNSKDRDRFCRKDMRDGTREKKNSSGNRISKKLTQEELARKREEMLGNAKWRDEQRTKNVKHYKHEHDRDEEALKKQYQNYDEENKAKFIRDMQVKSYSSEATASVEDRIKRNIYSKQRTKADLDKKFTQR